MKSQELESHEKEFVKHYPLLVGRGNFYATNMVYIQMKHWIM